MRRIAIINQKGGVGKTTTAVNLGAALARAGRRVVVVDLDPQANASVHLGAELSAGEPSTYGVLCAATPVAEALRPTGTPGLSLLPAHIDLSGAELELSSAIGRETILRDALVEWAARDPAVDYVLFDCPPSLGVLSVNGLAAAQRVLIVLQTEFFALQGLSKLVEVVQLMQRRLNPELSLLGVLPCLYDSRLRLAREVLGEIRSHFGERVFRTPIRCNVKLAEAPSHGRTIFEYDPASSGAQDHARLAAEVLEREEGGAETSPEPAPPDVAALEARLASLSRERTKPPPSSPAEESSAGGAGDTRGTGETGGMEEREPAAREESSGPTPGTAELPPAPAGDPRDALEPEAAEPEERGGEDEGLRQVEVPRPPARGALAPRGLDSYFGEDGGSMASRSGPRAAPAGGRDSSR